MKDDSGATSVEYGLIIVLISITIITAAATIGTGIEAKYQGLNEQIGDS